MPDKDFRHDEEEVIPEWFCHTFVSPRQLRAVLCFYHLCRHPGIFKAVFSGFSIKDFGNDKKEVIHLNVLEGPGYL